MGVGIVGEVGGWGRLEGGGGWRVGERVWEKGGTARVWIWGVVAALDGLSMCKITARRGGWNMWESLAEDLVDNRSITDMWRGNPASEHARDEWIVDSPL